VFSALSVGEIGQETGTREFRTDEEKVGLAIGLARENVLGQTGGPFGAAIFPAGRTVPVATGVNKVLPEKNSVLHAETVAIMAAESTLQTESLKGHEIFVSCEPCAMCLAAIYAAGLERLVFAGLREDSERIGFDEGPVFAQSYDYVTTRGLTVVRGLRRDEGAAVLQLYADRGGPIYG
jgi:tRNA(Arg) A34 adenosine deaminase TadA